MSKDTVYEIVTEQILKQLENGVAPWRKPWHVDTSAPRSIHGHIYSGVNVFLLLCAGYDNPFWITFKEVEKRGGRIRKGEHGTIVIYWKLLRVTDEITKEEKTIPMLRYYRVWNLEQVDGIATPKLETREEPTAKERHAEAARIVRQYPDAPKIRNAGSSAYYRPTTDVVTVPPKKSFDDLDEYYSTLFHELGHSTAHETRLNRETGDVFGSHAYGREELIAEMTSAFLAAESGIVTTQNNSAAYLDNWMRTIREDVRAVVVAAGKAQKAANYILDREHETTQEMAAA